MSALGMRGHAQYEAFRQRIADLSRREPNLSDEAFASEWGALVTERLKLPTLRTQRMAKGRLDTVRFRRGDRLRREAKKREAS